MEREVMFTGVGGQGVQIASKALATAAIDEGRQVMLVPRYGGGMRGGMTNAEVTIGDAPLRALPVATAALWVALGLALRQGDWTTPAWFLLVYAGYAVWRTLRQRRNNARPPLESP